MLPAAPGRLSTMTRWLICPWNFSLTMRATTSVGPPAGNPTSMRIGLLGQLCAWHAAPARYAAAPSAARTAFVDIAAPCHPRGGGDPGAILPSRRREGD